MGLLLRSKQLKRMIHDKISSCFFYLINTKYMQFQYMSGMEMMNAKIL